MQSKLNNQTEIITELAVKLQNQSDIMAEQAKINTEQANINVEQANVITEQAKICMFIAGQGEKISNLELENQRQQSSFVSFTATPTKTRMYNQGDHVLFDSVLINYGNSYNGENSTFICTYNAYYLFSISVRTSAYNLYLLSIL